MFVKIPFCKFYTKYKHDSFIPFLFYLGIIGFMVDLNSNGIYPVER